MNNSEITNLSRLIFDDLEFTEFTNLLKGQRFNAARLFVDKKYDELVIKNKRGEVTDHTLKLCNRLEDLAYDLVIGSTI